METTAELYDILAERLVGGVVFVVVLMITGIIGNVHVLFVYLFRRKSSNHRIFIVFLGVQDFLASVIAMPFTIITLRQPEIFAKTPICKLYWFANYFLVTASGLALLVIAIERYRKICAPLGWQLTHRAAILSCFIILLVTTGTSWPLLILMGTATIPTATPQITDSICATEDKENYDLYMIYYQAVMSVMVFICFVALVVIYALIWRVVRKYNAFKQNRYTCVNAEGSTPSDRTTSTKNSKETILADSQEPKSQFDRQRSKMLRTTDQNLDSGNRRKLDRAKKTIIAFILITVIFFISFTPYFVLTILIYSNSITDLTPSEVVFVNTIRYTPYINNMANVFIYGCFDVQFRREVEKIYKNMVCYKWFKGCRM